MDDLKFLFEPEQVAVIGASASRGKIGYSIVENLLENGYKKPIYPINPKAEKILGLTCHKSIASVGGPVDLAVISVPAKLTPQVVRECGEAKVKGVVIITAGFKEIGGEGLKLERELQKIGHQYKMRLVGPNCIGLMDTHTKLNASFANGFPQKGNISFISQSGAMVIAILDWSLHAGLGFSRFISLGNKADLSEIEFIKSCAVDPNTKVIL
ncbi:MAG: CoA-binding protein, partial [Firmicutes bacterium]|nr:CoA-binding protein [Bacillota bacterium]